MNCGDCGSETEMRGSERVCVNPACGARVRVRKVRKPKSVGQSQLYTGFAPLRFTGGGAHGTCLKHGNALPCDMCEDE